mmetsp:Transcript_7509/g.11379  ORF Transcript_7509/g.11379 Transcript_7509/m.11379 type:complete len:142 (-) Transcript_7509:208-633(-)
MEGDKSDPPVAQVVVAEPVAVQGYTVATAPPPTAPRGPNGSYVVVVQEGPGLRVPLTGGEEQPEDYCCLSWVSCLLCCWPLGLVAICQSCLVQSRYEQGDIAGAYMASIFARRFAIMAVIFGLILWAFGIFQEADESLHGD